MHMDPTVQTADKLLNVCYVCGLLFEHIIGTKIDFNILIQLDKTPVS